jgi:ABC-type Zn uptake system ZnuABC Zn-binding protein ZnuA
MGTVALTALEGTVGLWLSVKTNAPPGATMAVLSGAVFALSSATRAAIATVPRKAVASGAVAACLALALAACGSGSDASGNGNRVQVVATTTQIGDWVRQVGGDAVDVHQILKPSSDPHEYELRPADVEAAAGADVVFKNGDNLDGWADELVDKAGGDPKAVDLSKVVSDPLPAANGGSDPHWWHDPRNTAEALSVIRDTLVKAAPQRRQSFERNARSYKAKLHALDRSIATCLERLPPTNRELVTDHDALGYFARRYGLQIVGAVIPSQTTEAQPSAGELADLVGLIKREHVRAVFPEENVSKKLAESIARQAGASAEIELYSDTLGPAGSDGATYLGMEATNAERIVRGLNGGRGGCQAG